jgi:hypothetical protein
MVYVKDGISLERFQRDVTAGFFFRGVTFLDRVATRAIEVRGVMGAAAT